MTILMKLLGVVLVCSFLLVGCGETEQASPVSVEVSMTDDITYEPAEINVERGAEVTLTAANVSTNHEHDLTVLKGAYDSIAAITRATSGDSAVMVAGTGIVTPGDSETIVFTLQEPGEYQYFCSVRGHFAAGMTGTITVES